MLADLRPKNTDAAARVLSDAGFEVSTATVAVSSRDSVHALETPKKTGPTDEIFPVGEDGRIDREGRVAVWSSKKRQGQKLQDRRPALPAVPGKAEVG
jgi:hypothetical protein